MVDLSSLACLSIGFTLIVLALSLMLLWRVMSGKEKDLFCSGLCVMGLGVASGLVVGVFVWLTQALSAQEWSVFAGTGAIAIVLTGGILAIQGLVQKKPETLSLVKYGGIVIALIGLAFVIAWFVRT